MRLGAPLPTDGIVVLTLFVPGDAPVLCDGDRDPEHRRRFEIPDDYVPSIQHSLEAIARWEEERIDGRRFPFAVRDAVTDTLLGGCELRPRTDEAANLSYWVYPAHRNRGIASRAVALACNVAFADFGFRQVEVLTDPDNARSRAVANRNGFRVAGIRDGRVLHVLEAEWLTNRAVVS
jgi:RimJ/RimL family protein N-acetyltransferase